MRAAPELLSGGAPVRQGTGGVPEVLPGDVVVPAEELKLGESSVMAEVRDPANIPGPTDGSADSPEEQKSRPGAAQVRAGSRRATSKRAKALCKHVALAPTKFKDLASEVGRPTHQLMLRAGGEPFLARLDLQGNVSPEVVRVDPDPRCHVLICGAQDRALFRLLKAFRKMQ